MWPNPKETANLVTFTEEIVNGKLKFLGSSCSTDLLCMMHFQNVSMIHSENVLGFSVNLSEISRIDDYFRFLYLFNICK